MAHKPSQTHCLWVKSHWDVANLLASSVELGSCNAGHVRLFFDAVQRKLDGYYGLNLECLVSTPPLGKKLCPQLMAQFWKAVEAEEVGYC